MFDQGIFEYGHCLVEQCWIQLWQAVQSYIHVPKQLLSNAEEKAEHESLFINSPKTLGKYLINVGSTRYATSGCNCSKVVLDGCCIQV